MPAATLSAEAAAEGAPARLGWRPPCAVLLLLVAAFGLGQAEPTFGREAVLALGVFAGALVAWLVLQWDETPVALGAALALVALGVVPAASLQASLGHDLVWLLLGGFLLAAALQQSGLAERWTLAALAGRRSVRSLMLRLTLLVAASAFVIPSTSARAALLLPVLAVLGRAIGQPRITRALALLFVSVILLSAGASLLGAGAHLVALDFMHKLGLPAPGFLGWMLLAAPFALLSCLLACALIAALFLDRAQRQATVQFTPPPGAPGARRGHRVLGGIVIAAVLAWASSGWHGVPAWLVALAAALAAGSERLTGVSLKTALASVEWNLLLFMAGSLVLADALVASGAAARLGAGLVALLPQGLPAPLLAGAAASIALASHLVITSRSARALVLVPTVALPLAALGLDAAVAILVVTLGGGFCQTLAVSAKPVLLFKHTETATFDDADLLRLALALALPLALLLVASALWWWPLFGVGSMPH
jgi:di/tricarboxylate transporter